jgi:hypothetical protein
LRKTLILVAALLAVVGAAAAATAAIPDANGVIHGCYKRNAPNRGLMRVIDSEAGQTCPSGYAPLNWNRTGPAGPRGPAGPAGASGVSGYEIIGSTKTVQVDAGQTNYGDFIDTCAARNKRPVGGGGYLTLPDAVGDPPSPAPGWSVGATFPFNNGQGTEAWVVQLVRAPGGAAATYTFRMWVACATAS